MKITNNHDLPQPLVNAVERDPYSMGNARISVTGLLRPPRITLLYKRHSPEIVTDVVDHIWSLMGRAIHKVLEDGGDEQHITEERLFAEVRGWRISGQVDLQKKGNRYKITDYKNTSAYTVRQEKKEWAEQLNSYAWLVREATGMEVEAVNVCAIVRDWSRHRAKEDQDYPQAPAVMVPVPLWTHEEAGRFVEERVRVHQAAIAGWDMGDEPPPCSDAERWMRPDTWAVIKQGNKRPSKVCESVGEANEYAGQRGDAYYVQHRPGEPIRCSGNYCQVAPWCKQYAEWQKG